MKEGKQYSFWQLISSSENNNAIIIPQIQRDYVQHRTGKVETNINRFVNNLVSSITMDNKWINLNFVYGNATKKYDSQKAIDAFAPIDGQQRLTTLFLLHYYIFNEAGSHLKNELKKHFFYETRSTTQEFIDLLVEKNDKQFYNNAIPSVAIRDASWYSALWEFDPSILSCLVVLDKINARFEEIEEGVDWERLSNLLTSDHCPITFMKMEIEGIDKPNELYIKMNSRGKQLTAFENFKTELYGYIKQHSEFFSITFKERMDGEWLNFLWELCEEFDPAVCEKYTDVLYREVLHYIIVNRICAFDKTDAKEDNLEEIFKMDNPEKLYLSDYQNNLSEDEFVTAIQDVFYTMNLLSGLDVESRAVVTKDIFGLRYEKEDLYSTISQYMQRVLLFAVTEYAVKADVKNSVDSKQFMEWWRVAKNLIVNSQIDSLKTYHGAISALDQFKHMVDIVDYLIGQNDNINVKFIDLPALALEQCREEILKQKIIINSFDSKWKDVIFQAEQHEYFNGELLFALKLAGVNSCADANQKALELFKENWTKINEIFDELRDDIGIHRVLLVYGDYSEEKSRYADDDYLLNYYFNDMKHHQQDWRGLLRKTESLKIFSDMLNDFKASGKKFSEFVLMKCNGIKTVKDIIPPNHTSDKQELHYYLIKEPEMFEYIKAYGRCRYYQGQLYLLRTSTRGSLINYKLFVVYTKLKKLGKDVKFYEGKGDCKGTDRDSLRINGKHYFCGLTGFYLDDKSGENVVAETIDEMVDYLK